MKKVAVLGAGRMGQAIGWGMTQLGHDVSMFDRIKPHGLGEEVGIVNMRSQSEVAAAIQGCHLAISALPYHLNYEVACVAADLHVNYCDLGGHVGTSQSINNLILSNHSSTFTDLGLAPGWVNIVTEEGYRQVAGADSGEPIDVAMAVGGLPHKHTKGDPLQYVSTWSFEGLTNEYDDDCKVLIDGKVCDAPGMSAVERFQLPWKDSEGGDLKGFTFEKFRTSGGAAHTIGLMQDRGVRNCEYKTIRFPGHRDTWKYLSDVLTPEAMTKIIKHDPIDAGDMVIIMVEIDSGPVMWSKYYAFIGDKDGFSAMQKCTAFPMCAVANQILLDPRVPPTGKLDYSNVQYESFNTHVDKLMDKARHADFSPNKVA